MDADVISELNWKVADRRVLSPPPSLGILSTDSLGQDNEGRHPTGKLATIVLTNSLSSNFDLELAVFKS